MVHGLETIHRMNDDATKAKQPSRVGPSFRLRVETQCNGCAFLQLAEHAEQTYIGCAEPTLLASCGGVIQHVADRPNVYYPAQTPSWCPYLKVRDA